MSLLGVLVLEYLDALGLSRSFASLSFIHFFFKRQITFTSSKVGRWLFDNFLWERLLGGGQCSQNLAPSRWRVRFLTDGSEQQLTSLSHKKLRRVGRGVARRRHFMRAPTTIDKSIHTWRRMTAYSFSKSSRRLFDTSRNQMQEIRASLLTRTALLLRTTHHNPCNCTCP